MTRIGPFKMACGCVCTPSAWTNICAMHAREHDELHTRAAREYRRPPTIVRISTPEKDSENDKD